MFHNALATHSSARFTSSPVPNHVRTPLAAKPSPLQVFKSNPANQCSRTALVCTPPPGHQFLTAFDCKYYGTSTVRDMHVDAVTGSMVTKLVKNAIKKNNRAHRKVWFRITDQGIRVTSMNDDAAEVDLGAGMLRRIVPGTLKTKSGKTYRVALVIERYPTEDDMMRYHVFQFKHDDDVRYMYDASKRMWRDHMFSALLDVSTEGGQNMFDSFSIENDIEQVNQRCSKLLEEEMFSFNTAIEGLLDPVAEGVTLNDGSPDTPVYFDPSTNAYH